MRRTEDTGHPSQMLTCCVAHRDRLIPTAELSERHGASRRHLMNVVSALACPGMLETTLGRGGGLRRLKGLFGAALPASVKALDAATRVDILGPRPVTRAPFTVTPAAGNGATLKAPVTRRPVTAKRTESVERSA